MGALGRANGPMGGRGARAATPASAQGQITLFACHTETRQVGHIGHTSVGSSVFYAAGPCVGIWRAARDVSAPKAGPAPISASASASESAAAAATRTDTLRQ